MAELNEILENLKWHNVIDKLPFDGSQVEVRSIYPYSARNDSSEKAEDLTYEKCFFMYYYMCAFFVTSDDKKHGKFEICSDVSVKLSFKKCGISYKNIDGIDEYGNIILLDTEKDTDILKYYQWRYLVEEDGEISKFSALV